MSTVMYLRFHNFWRFMTGCATGGFSRTAQIIGVRAINSRKILQGLTTNYGYLNTISPENITAELVQTNVSKATLSWVQLQL